MVLKFFKTKKQAINFRKKLRNPIGVVINPTSLKWRKGDKRRKDKKYVLRG